MENDKLVFAFDLGNVVFDFDYNLALAQIKDKIGVSPQVIIKEFYDNDFCIPFEKGLVSSHKFYLRFKETFLAELTYEDFVDAWCKIFSPNPETIELIKKLNDLYSVYLISNINELHFDHLFSRYGSIFSLFKELIISCRIKSVKPEQKIYQELKKKAGVGFKDIIYIDDRQDLIDAAGLLGLKSLRFINVKQLIQDLQRFNIRVN